ncbi:MAG TPA: C40 family peptidase [Piscinibacter sp.]|jgi:cell wall-associated NlpC family hydrolase|uniref:C40 family peptidase n=1 Tax=Piscinibacter sp. TaxID=1903157 RepID=UPI001B71A11F|nr:C40 family peptidase [Piscinibacter sp.]MBK7530055.1 C40 family peptidase [Piscinibacter sp.]MBL0090951.1 C40 family peptidase [Piscinibacter sp.]MBP6543809.1 C40 family peptidase [Piscinibacter sp.]HNW64577.1 C40 family peptidase [Piscinibacter sp.]HOY36948.1 C40 family peptidase [Piscinibacter sp.]
MTRRHRALSRSRLAAAALLALASALVQASPDASHDPIAKLLADRGLGDPDKVPAAVPPSDYEFVNKVRDKASDMVLSAMNFLGVPYRRGGNSADKGFDCSGFTRHVFEMSLGLVLPRRADEQASAPGLKKIRREELKPGDLVFFNTLKRTFSHVGIYIGEGKFIHAPRTGGEVRVEDMRYAYWSKRFTGARRALPLEAAAESARVENSVVPAKAVPAATPLVTPATDAETFRTLH